MSETQEVDVLVLRGGQGEVYAIPFEVLESFRVPEEHAAELGDDEVAGFGGPSFILGPVKPWVPPPGWGAPPRLPPGGFRPSSGHPWAR